MVGVPRSKGCNTCRKRRIACSLERPQCQQCIKSKRVCSGYQKELVFVTSEASNTPAGKQWRQTQYQAPYADPPAQPKTVHQWMSPVTLQALTGPINLEKAALKQQTLGKFLNSFRKEAVVEGGPSYWLAQIPGLTSVSKALEMSILALCSARLARKAEDDDGRLLRASTVLYGEALHAVRQAVSNPAQAYNPDNVGASLILAMYEVFECPGKVRDAYTRHIEGCGKLVQIRGPKAHQEGTAHAVFLAYRTQGCMNAILERKTFLSDPKWKTIPFAKVVKSPLDLLIDILLDWPVLLARADHVNLLPTPQAQLVEGISVTTACEKMVDDLHQLYDDLQQSVAGPLYWPVFSELKDKVSADPKCEDIKDLFPLQYAFADIRIATTLSLYWGTLSMLHSAVTFLHQMIGVLKAMVEGSMPTIASGSEQSDCFIQGQAKLIAEVHHVCSSVQYFMQDDLGLPFIAAPLNMIVQILKLWPIYSTESRWAKRALQLVKMEGVQIVDYMPQLEDMENTTAVSA